MAKKENLKCWKCKTPFDPASLDSERNRRQLPEFNLRCPAMIEEQPGVQHVCGALNRVTVIEITARYEVSKPE